MNEAEFRKAFAWSDVRKIIAYPTRKRIDELSHKDLARCYAALLNDLVVLKKRLDAMRENDVRKE